MNRGLLLKSLRDAAFLTVLFGLGVGLTEALLARALPRVHEHISAVVSHMAFMQRVLQALLGTNVSGGLGPEMIAAFAWVHPVVLALLWGHAIAYCTLAPAGEVDRGTIDMLLGLPVSRWQLYLAGSVVWLAAGVVLMLAAVAGHLIGCRLSDGSTRLASNRLVIVRGQSSEPVRCGRGTGLAGFGDERPARQGGRMGAGVRAGFVSAQLPGPVLAPGGSVLVSFPAPLLQPAVDRPGRALAGAGHRRSARFRWLRLDNRWLRLRPAGSGHAVT